VIAEENEAEARASRWADGDAGEHLEELVVDALPSLLTAEAAASALEIELVGPHLRLQGLVNTGYFRRVSDFLNHKEGLIDLQAATILRRNGDATKVRTPNIWVSPDEVTLIGQNTDPWADQPHTELWVEKVRKTLIVVTPGHTLTGDVYITREAQLAVYVESNDPQWVPMTDVRTRSLADRRIISRYPFALLNRRHIVAATELQPGMIPGRTVL